MRTRRLVALFDDLDTFAALNSGAVAVGGGVVRPRVVPVAGSNAALVLVAGSNDSLINVAGTNTALVSVVGAEQRTVSITGSNDTVISVTGNEDMPSQQNITLYLTSDQVVRCTIAGSGSITGQLFRAKIKFTSDLAGAAVLNGVPTISDAVNRVVDWVIADTDWAGIVEGSNYTWDLWRDDAGSDIPLVYGSCTIQRLPGS